MNKAIIRALAALRVLAEDLRVTENTATENVLLAGAVCGSIMWMSVLCGLLCRLFGVA